MTYCALNKKAFTINILSGFFLFIVLYVLGNLYAHQFILTRALYYTSFANKLSYNSIDQMLNFQERWKLVGYFAIPVLLFIKIAFASACLSIGCFLSDIKLSFKDLFRIAIVAEICLACGMITRVICITFMHINTLSDIQNFSPLSLAQLLGPQSIPKYLLYLCQTINIFEIGYWFVLAAGLVAFLGKPFGKMFKLVMSSYGVGLLLWIVFVSYLTVTFAP